ncbi:MAG TPA: hypothetical protein VIW64_05905 [Pyrinomonadaceae bacterium]|jgi:hypothetical protein
MAKDTYRNYIKHLESIIQMYKDAPVSNGQIRDSDVQGILARAEAAIEKICGEDSAYTNRMKAILDGSYHDSYRVSLIVGIIRALRIDLEDGYLYSFSELVRGEMFENLIEMAQHLIEEGYKDAAAVIGGASLESHLRQLSNKHGISVDYTAKDGSLKKKKAEHLNQELGKHAYSLFDQKQITAWLDLRNNAAHGNYSEYGQDQVAKLIEWVGDFIKESRIEAAATSFSCANSRNTPRTESSVRLGYSSTISLTLMPLARHSRRKVMEMRVLRTRGLPPRWSLSETIQFSSFIVVPRRAANNISYFGYT